MTTGSVEIFDRHTAELYGLKPSDGGRGFDHPRHGRCTIVGLDAHPGKSPVLFRRERDGRVYRTEVASIGRYLAD